MYIIIHTRVAHWAQAQFILLTVYSYYLYKTSSLMSTYKDPLLYNYRYAHTNIHYSFILCLYFLNIYQNGHFIWILDNGSRPLLDLVWEEGIEWNAKNNFRIFFPSSV